MSANSNIEVSLTSNIVYSVFCGAVQLSTLIGNTLICLVVLRNKHLQNFTTFLLVNLAVSDFMVGLFGTVHFLLALILKNEVEQVCRILDSILFLSAAVSIYSLVLISAEKYLAIMKPFVRRTRVTVGLLRFIIPGVWIWSSILTSPLFYFLINGHNNRQELFCWETFPQKPLKKPYKYFLFFALYLFPMLILCFIYARIVHRLWFESGSAKGTNIFLLRSRQKLTKMLACVILVFNICWFPWFVVDIISASTDWIIKPSWFLLQLLSLFAVSNSSANVVIYWLQSQVFRRYMKNLLFCFNRQVQA